MRAIGLAGLAAACLLAGCGGKTNHQRLVETCVADGEAPETCACIVDAMEAKLSPDLFKRTAVAVAREKREVEDFIDALPADEKMEFLGAAMEMGKCQLSAVGGD